jgi:regulatory protein spx
MTINELVRFVRNNPSVLKRPIIVSEKNFQVGYDADEITAFLPKELRFLPSYACNETCPNYKACGVVHHDADQKQDA